jgi:hypothetical protein
MQNNPLGIGLPHSQQKPVGSSIISSFDIRKYRGQ